MKIKSINGIPRPEHLDGRWEEYHFRDFSRKSPAQRAAIGESERQWALLCEEALWHFTQVRPQYNIVFV